MKVFKTNSGIFTFFALITVVIVTSYQNCGQKVGFSEMPSVANSQSIGTVGACGGISCSLAPLTSKAAVTTILLALGDEANSQLVINGASSQLIAETVVRYSTPVTNPKILVVSDWNNQGESPGDLSYVAATLLQRYQVTEMSEPTAGLAASDLAGYDLVWFNNPGWPMGSPASRDALIAFQGGVILQGDDMSQGNGFDISTLTGLKNIDNGTSIICGATTYYTDDNAGSSYLVTLNSGMFAASTTSALQFNYGNDLDNTVAARADLEVLATAKGSPSDCVDLRPAIVRYFK